jgi:hypothetical protein
MGSSCGSLEDQNAIRNVDKKGWAYEVSDENKDTSENWTRDHSCYILENTFVHDSRLWETE